MEQRIRHHRSLLVLCSVLSLIAGGLIGFFTPHPRGRPLTVVTPDPTVTPLPTPTTTPLRVYVSGAVASPAVYRLPPGSLAEDALNAAGGPTGDADLDCINLARELVDQQQIYVPHLGEAEPPPPLSGGAPGTSDEGRVDINAATAEELDTLPQIGPTTAQQIVEHRETHGPFETIEELLQVPGIGPGTFEEIQDRITVGQTA